MNRLKNVARSFVKGFVLLIIIPALIHGVLLFVHSMARVGSIYFCSDPIQRNANNYLAKYGNKYAALDMIYYVWKEQDIGSCELSAHHNTLYSLYNKYPNMKEQYLAALVNGILDISTKPYNRDQLVWHLSALTGVDFENIPDDVRSEIMGPYEYKDVSEVEKWWEEHNREKLLKVQ